MPRDDLDVPGAEIDDQPESEGSGMKKTIIQFGPR
jgi:hypothetical protein